MKNTDFYLSELKEIRQMMEQSSRFLSLSGLSGILIGIYALIGAYIASGIIDYLPLLESTNEIIIDVLIVALCVLALSFITVMLFSYRRAKRNGKKIWTSGARLMILNLSIPLITGAILVVIFITRGMYSIVSPSLLVFYGLALINAAKFTHQEIFYMGLIEVVLGIIAAVLPEYGLLIWAVGFGLIHIIYGSVMYFRYEREKNAEE